ncbi:MAG: hypothetical protein QM754_02175 [Tepidisphaeraceae bacterium]
MPSIEELAFKTNAHVTGIRWHDPSEQFIAEIGYHELSSVAPDGIVTTKRVRTVHYLGGNRDRDAYLAKFRALKDEWEQIVGQLRATYDKERERCERLGLPLPARFKPVWPDRKTVRRGQKPTVDFQAEVHPAVISVTPTFSPSLLTDAEADEDRRRLNLTVREAYALYVEQQQRRIGLMGGKGISQNTFVKHCQCLMLSLGLNETYSRPTRPINLDKRLGDLTANDYESFVMFWCNKAHLASERSAFNYTRAFRQMITRLEIRTPRRFKEIFEIRITEPTKITRYDADLLRIFTHNEVERVRMIALLALNCGYYQIDIARLKFEHITDFEGNPYQSGEMFIKRRRERTKHQNRFTTTTYIWPETQRLMEKFRAPLANPFGNYFLSQIGTPFSEKTVAWDIDKVKRDLKLRGKISMKQFRKIGASQIMALADSDAMHQYKANAFNAADAPYIDRDFTRLTNALKKFREKLIADGVMP